MTAEDVKFSFERYRGAAAKLFKEKVAAVEVVDPQRVRVPAASEPWPDFMAFFATPATGAAWIVPKAYVEKVGEDGFKKAPVGAGPYKFVSFNPGVELVLEAHEQLLAQAAQRQAARLPRGAGRGDASGHAQARGGRRRLLDPRRAGGGAQAHAGAQAQADPDPRTFWVDFTRAMEPEVAVARPARAPGRQPAIDRQAISQAETLGFSKVARASSPRPSSSTGRPPPYRLRSRRGQAAPGRSRAIRRASTPASSPATPPTRTWPRPWSTTSRRWASRRASGRSSGSAS